MVRIRDKILIIEDDSNLAYILQKQLESFGYITEVAKEGENGLDKALSNKYSLCIIDIGLPEISGFKIIKRIREHDMKTPIIVITNTPTSKNERETFVKGANLFHKKPIDFGLLKDQIKSMLFTLLVKPVIELGDLRIEPQKRYLERAGKELKLSNKEFELLLLLVNAKGDVLTRDDIIYRTFRGVNDVEQGSIDTLVSRTRKKLGNYKGKDVIETVHGVGFRLNLAYIKGYQTS